MLSLLICAAAPILYIYRLSLSTCFYYLALVHFSASTFKDHYLHYFLVLFGTKFALHLVQIKHFNFDSIMTEMHVIKLLFRKKQSIKTITIFNAKLAIFESYNRHDQYWKTAYPNFLVTKNCMKKYGKLFRFGVQFSSTVLVIDTFHVKCCSVLTQY